MEARMQEGSHWDYSLQRGMQHLDCFSTFPQYWSEDQDPIQILANRGNPEMVYLVFGVPIESLTVIFGIGIPTGTSREKITKPSLKEKLIQRIEAHTAITSKSGIFWPALESTIPVPNIVKSARIGS